jgi:aspartate racemase
MGPEATQIFYQRIIARTDASCDQEHVPALIWSDCLIPDRTACLLSGREEEVYARLLADARLLENGGCTVLAIPCNTSHYFADRLGGDVGIPVLHMLRETVGRLTPGERGGGQTRGKIGILATDGTVRTGLYQTECDKAGLTAVLPPPEIQKLVMSLIYDEIKRGEPGSREKFAEIDRALRALGCTRAILGCTELSVFRNHHNLPPFYLDAMEVLAECAIRACGRNVRTI